MGAPIIRIIVFWGLYWGPLILGNYLRWSLKSVKMTYIRLFESLGYFMDLGVGVWVWGATAHVGPGFRSGFGEFESRATDQACW